VISTGIDGVLPVPRPRGPVPGRANAVGLARFFLFFQ
jgi:hypothetical protein